MNAKHGKPAGTTGTVTFDASAYKPGRTIAAVRTAEGHVYVNLQGALWVPANVRDDQFTVA